MKYFQAYNKDEKEKEKNLDPGIDLLEKTNLGRKLSLGVTVFDHACQMIYPSFEKGHLYLSRALLDRTVSGSDQQEWGDFICHA